MNDQSKIPEEDEVEASKAPLMSHLIELRSRLIKALLAFFIAAIACFFAKQIYNVLVWPMSWWPASRTRNSSIRRCWNICHPAQARAVRRSIRFLSDRCDTDIQVRGPGLYRNERHAFLPYLIATPIFFTLGALVVYFAVMPMLVRFSLGMQQSGDGQPEIVLLPKVVSISR
jgi:sec-independent protein translocase protein TatC